jgi:predicted metalloprotease with PDZ domain
MSRRALVFALALIAAPAVAAGQRAALDISYRVGMREPASHLYDVEIAIVGLSAEALRLQMPVWSPGRYARMDFAKNVQEFTAGTPDGRPLAWEKEHGSAWRVSTGGARRVVVRYRVFANNLSGTFSVLDTAHANWNGASLFMYVVGRKPNPVTLRVEPPPGWVVMNAETRAAGEVEYRFPNYDLLVDTPTEVAAAPALAVDSFRVDGRLYRTVIHYNGGPPVGARRRFVRDVERIVRYQNTVIAPPPLETYTFLFNIAYEGGDGMEHLYSTQIMNPGRWTDTAVVLPAIGTAAHEYFHTWNVKRIRPRALGPFDYASEQHQPSLWVAEGWTQYYGQVTLHRAGIVDRAYLYNLMANAVVRPNLTHPGRKEVSARMASFQAPFFDGDVPEMQTNARNTFFSYYTKGSGLAMVLDLMIRGRTANARSLDDALRALKRATWDQPAATYYLQGRGYTEGDVERAVSAAAGTDMSDFFARHVAGRDDPPFDAALAHAGLRLVRGDTTWAIEEIPGATPAQLRVREGWLTGRVGGAPVTP